MAEKIRKRKHRIKRKVKVKESVSIIKKEDVKGRVAPTKTISTDNGARFKVKIRKKT